MDLSQNQFKFPILYHLNLCLSLLVLPINSNFMKEVTIDSNNYLLVINSEFWVVVGIEGFRLVSTNFN